MVFLKPLEKLEFADIEQLRINKICESQILDFKRQILTDKKLVKQVSAFANTQGGFLIFGVEETGKGGYPKEIVGIDKGQINKERVEQIILGNIQPRLNVKIQIVEHQDTSKVIVVIQIPNSHLKPHMNSYDNKFYKRYNFEALPMTEMEVNDSYRRRFIGYQEVESYISNLLTFERFPLIKPQIIGNIIVIPTILKRIIDTSNIQDFSWMDNLDFKPKYLRMPTIPKPSPDGVKCESIGRDGHVLEGLEIHRNGCVHHATVFGREFKEKMIFDVLDFGIKLLHILQFASTLYQRYNYFGDVKVVCNLLGVKDSWLIRGGGRYGIYKEYPCQVAEINVSREFSTSEIESKYEYMASGIMDDIFNCYGLWKCPFFDDEGNFKESTLKR